MTRERRLTRGTGGGASVASQVAILLIHHDRLSLWIITLPFEATRGPSSFLELIDLVISVFEEMMMMIIIRVTMIKERSVADGQPEARTFLFLCGY